MLAGSTKLEKGRRLAGYIDDEAITVLLDDDESTGDEDTVGCIRFGEDHSSWKWVVSIYQSPTNVRFVRVPN